MTLINLVLDLKLNVKFHVHQEIKKCNKLIGLIIRLAVNVATMALVNICKSFIRPHLDYGDILYDKP